MKSLVARLALWFVASLLVVTLVMVFATRHHLEEELHQKNWKHDYPTHPDWKLHGSYSEAEIDDILGELTEGALLYGLPVAAGVAALGYWLARKSVQPISSLNKQLQGIDALHLAQRIDIPEIDREFRDLVGHINALLDRLQVAFSEMSEYAAKVAHELRTPLSILRLKVEQAASSLPADFLEELDSQLHQLRHVVDQSLLIAKAEQGRVALNRTKFDLAAIVSDIGEDFSRLAQEDNRSLELEEVPPTWVYADLMYARQMIHSFFSNAYKHGKGAIHVGINPGDRTWILCIRNPIRSSPGEAADTLGLGLRVVDSLLKLQPEMKCRRTQSAQEFRVELEFPRAE